MSRSGNVRRLVVSGVVGGAAALGGCGGGGKGGADSVAPPGESPVVAETDRGSVLNAGALARDVAPEAEFVSERGERMRVRRDVAGASGGDGSWRVRRYLGAADEAGPATREQVFEIDGAGSLVLREEINRAERVEVVFRPGLVVLPGGLGVGETREQTLEMVVHPLGDRSRVKSKGAMLSRVTNEGGEDVMIERGAARAVRGVRVRSGFTAELKPARVENESTQWFVPGVGLVKEVERERTAVLGVTIRNNADTWVLQRAE